MKIKKWNGSAWVQEYPEVNVANIVATGTASGSTFLRGDGTWATPSDVDTNNYLTGVSGSGNGTVTFTRQGLSNLTFNAAHTHDDRYYTESESDSRFGFVGSISDFANGTLVVTNLTGGDGPSWTIEVTGKGYGSGVIKFQAEGYNYNTASGGYYATAGMNYGRYALSYIKVLNYNGNLAFWWPRIQYWNSFEARVTETSISGIRPNRVTSIINSAEPSSSTKTQIDLVQNINSATIGSQSVNYATSSGSTSGNAATATKLATTRNIALSGDVTGSANFDGSANISITATVADDSHNHIIGNVDGLQTALDGKSNTGHAHSATEIVTGELNTARLGSGTASAGLVLKSDGDGTASWQADNNTTYTLGSFGVTATASELNLLDGEAITTTELNYLSGVTSNIQTQLNGKQATITNNVAGSTFSGAYASPGGGTNTGVILYGDYYGWHTRSIGAAGTALISNGSTPNWSSAGIATYSTATLYVKRIYTRTASSGATWTERYDATTGTGTSISTTSTWTTLALGFTPSTTEQFMIELSNSSSNAQENGICIVGYGTNQSTAGMSVISYDAYETVDNGQLKIAKYYCQWYITGSSIGFRYGSKMTW